MASTIFGCFEIIAKFNINFESKTLHRMRKLSLEEGGGEKEERLAIALKCGVEVK